MNEGVRAVFCCSDCKVARRCQLCSSRRRSLQLLCSRLHKQEIARSFFFLCFTCTKLTFNRTMWQQRTFCGSKLFLAYSCPASTILRASASLSLAQRTLSTKSDKSRFTYTVSTTILDVNIHLKVNQAGSEFERTRRLVIIVSASGLCHTEHDRFKPCLPCTFYQRHFPSTERVPFLFLSISSPHMSKNMLRRRKK